MLGVNSMANTLRSILAPGNNLSSELSTALISIGTSIDHMRTKQDALSKELELVRKLSRSNWLLIINLPLPFGVTKIQAVQNLFSELGFCKPLFDADRDLIATDLVYVNRSGLLANMSIFIPQRHYDHVLSAAFQKSIMEHNKKLPKEQWVAVGRVLTPREREDYETCCSLKRLILAKLRHEKLGNPKLHVPFIIVDKRSLRLRIDKEMVLLDEAAAKYGISTDSISDDRARHARPPAIDSRKRPGPSVAGPGGKQPRN
ncbi:unnamed protein product [Cylicocyclus nassatus]|uniref:Uncharacterized protein n=1 Tax=Cylicocyclus nassatus TaxID=53992 RepID=A0AA36HAC7_CYLNA|nr:unnamed protein product [Cylicocyclus nassatus]